MSQTTSNTARISALQQAGIAIDRHQADAVCIQEISTATLLRLQSLAAVEQLQSAVATCGIDLPAETLGSQGHDPLALCLRPGEWLLFSEQPLVNLQQSLQQALDTSSAGTQSALNDCSDGLAVFRLSGPAAPWLLSKVSSLDFIAADDAGQHAARTRMAQAAVVVSYHPVGEAGSEFVFDLIFDRSLAAYLWQLLLSSVPHAQEVAATFSKNSR